MSGIDQRLADPEFRRFYFEHASEPEKARVREFLQGEAARAGREGDPETWIRTTFPRHATAPLAAHHREFWDWLWEVVPGVRPTPFINVWPRGGAKSSSAEMAAVALGARHRRKYGLYVGRVQDGADDHVQNIGSMLESPEIAEAYPDLGEQLVGKFGNSKGWRRNRLRTRSGFTIDAIGLDTASRGAKLDENRPDFMILDDLDQSEDSPKVTRKLINLLTKALLPAGSEDLAIIGVQNLIHPNGIFARLVNGQADYLRKRIISGPIPALEDFAYDQNDDGTYRIVSGRPTWVGFDVPRCEDMLNEIGPKAFREECQHDVERVEGALWARAQCDVVRVPRSQVPDMAQVVVFVDPSGGDGEDNDEQGISVCGRGVDGKGYVLDDRSVKLKPHGWGTAAAQAYYFYKGDYIGGEPNYGGDMVMNTIRTIDPKIKYVPVGATRGKVWRAEPVSALFGDVDRPESWKHTKVHLVDSMPGLEDELCTWSEGCGWSPNRADAMWGALTALMLQPVKDPFSIFAGTA